MENAPMCIYNVSYADCIKHPAYQKGMANALSWMSLTHPHSELRISTDLAWGSYLGTSDINRKHFPRSSWSLTCRQPLGTSLA